MLMVQGLRGGGPQVVACAGRAPWMNSNAAAREKEAKLAWRFVTLWQVLHKSSTCLRTEKPTNECRL